MTLAVAALLGFISAQVAPVEPVDPVPQPSADEVRAAHQKEF